MIELFNQGGPFMWPILGLLVFALVLVLERIYTLTKSSLATRNFVPQVNEALEEGGIKEAIKVCEETPGAVSEIFHAGLSRAKHGLQSAEKAISDAGTVEMAFLERGMVWLSMIIAVAPMLGFAGTVAGMVKAFQDIEAANNISPAVVAGGISQALLTTLFGLIVGIITQIFYNFFTSRVDKIVIDMEENTLNLMDKLAEKLD